MCCSARVLGGSTASTAVPVTGSTPCSGAQDRAEGNPNFIRARHEETAAFMATAHAEFTD